MTIIAIKYYYPFEAILLKYNNNDISEILLAKIFYITLVKC